MESSGNGSPTPPTVYKRSDSEVVEKPIFQNANDLMALFDDDDNTYSESEVEVQVIESSQSVPCYSPVSQHSNSSSSKGDIIDGSGDEWEGQGDVDEGFDEEFCDGEDKEIDVNLVAINQLLVDDNVDFTDPMNTSVMSMPNTQLFEDFDLGVDVLDTELHHSEPVKSPMVSHPSSPYQLVATSPATIATADMQLMSLNERNNYLSHEHSSSPSSVHSHQSVPNMIEEDDLSVFFSNDMSSYDVQSTQAATPITATGYQPFSCSTSYPATTYTYSQQGTVSSTSYNPTLTSVNLPLNDLMDMTEVSKIVTSESDGMMLDSCYNGTHASVPVMTSTSTTIATGSASPNPYMQNQISSNNIIIPQTLGVDSRSQGSQTPSTSNTSSHQHLRRSLSPAPTPSQSSYPPPSPAYSTTSSGACYYPTSPQPHSPASSYASLSPGPVDNTQTLTPEKQKLVDMPFHQFKKILDDPTVPEKDKEDIKAVRRRGKNKEAAKNCRKKKLSVLCGLQQEVDQLKLAINRHNQKTRSLEQAIAFYKTRCSRNHGPIALSRKHS